MRIRRDVFIRLYLKVSCYSARGSDKLLVPEEASYQFNGYYLFNLSYFIY